MERGRGGEFGIEHGWGRVQGFFWAVVLHGATGYLRAPRSSCRLPPTPCSHQNCIQKVCRRVWSGLVPYLSLTWSFTNPAREIASARTVDVCTSPFSSGL